MCYMYGCRYNHTNPVSIANRWWPGDWCPLRPAPGESDVVCEIGMLGDGGWLEAICPVEPSVSIRTDLVVTPRCLPAIERESTPTRSANTRAGYEICCGHFTATQPRLGRNT